MASLLSGLAALKSGGAGGTMPNLTGGASGASQSDAIGGANKTGIYNVSGGSGVFLWVSLAAVIFGVVWMIKKK